jgi:hypothetical protein
MDPSSKKTDMSS